MPKVIEYLPEQEGLIEMIEEEILNCHPHALPLHSYHIITGLGGLNIVRNLSSPVVMFSHTQYFDDMFIETRKRGVLPISSYTMLVLKGSEVVLRFQIKYPEI